MPSTRGGLGYGRTSCSLRCPDCQGWGAPGMVPVFFSFLAVRLEVACVGKTTFSLGEAREALAL